MEEIAPPDCIFAGSVFVSRRAREFLEGVSLAMSSDSQLTALSEKLKHSKYGSADSLDHITRKFDETTKRLFRDRNELQFIPFGSPLDKVSRSITKAMIYTNFDIGSSGGHPFRAAAVDWQ